jgi:hypothetical protein
VSSTVLWDPAEGLAAARCQLARWKDPAHRLSADHPSSCVFCPYPDLELARLVDGWNEWAGLDERGRYARLEVERFAEEGRRSPTRQRELITAAQELTGEPWPPPPATPAKEEPVTVEAPNVPERPSWL